MNLRDVLKKGGRAYHARLEGHQTWQSNADRPSQPAQI